MTVLPDAGAGLLIAACFAVALTADPDPTVCETCAEAFDPDDTAPQADACDRTHCDTCRDDCPTCTRPGCRADH